MKQERAVLAGGCFWGNVTVLPPRDTAAERSHQGRQKGGG